MIIKKLIMVLAITILYHPIIAQTSNLINGVFTINQIKYSTNVNTKTIATQNGVSAYFTYTPSLTIPLNNLSNAGNVSFNSAALNYDNVNKFYSKVDVSSYTQQNWTVSGNGSIPSMNFIYSGVLPSFDVNALSIDTILKKSDSLFVNINNILQADSILITINDNNAGTPPHYIALQAPNYTNRYYLTPAMFSPLVLGGNSVIKVEAINYNYQTISGKLYLFRNSFCYVQTGVRIIN